MLSDILRLIKGFVLFIGPSSAGKTSILRRLVTGKFEDQKPTLSYWEENIAKVRIIEIGGQESLKKYWKVALDQNPLWIFFVIDVTKEKDYMEYKDFITSDNYSKLSERTTLTANKIDLINTTPSHLTDDGYVVKCSAKTGDGMLDILEMIANLESNANSVGKNQQFKQTTDSGENKGDKLENKKAESILKEFQGKF